MDELFLMIFVIYSRNTHHENGLRNIYGDLVVHPARYARSHALFSTI
jgi:hypothetical protein